MRCPNCPDINLQSMLTKQGVEIDYCDRCKGIWLDRGELYHFVRKRKQVAKHLEDAARKHADQHQSQPPLFEISAQPESPVLDSLLDINPDDLTPRQALEQLYKLKQLMTQPYDCVVFPRALFRQKSGCIS